MQGGEAGGQAAISELIKEATLLSSMRHPNVVWVYGIVLRPMKSNDDSDDDDELMDRDNGDAVDLAAALARQPPTGGAGVVRPPAIVVEYMGQGSLKGALARKADIVQGALIKVLIAMDAAKVTSRNRESRGAADMPWLMMIELNLSRTVPVVALGGPQV